MGGWVGVVGGWMGVGRLVGGVQCSAVGVGGRSAKVGHVRESVAHA